MAMSVITVDSKGRILLPREVRKALDLQPGDALFLTKDGQIVSLAKAESPFDRLAAQAVAEYYAGDTVSLEEALRELDAVEPDESE
ncbi:MAG: AbrB/MazE/SpoVT family DNA-binding domain-containing protein [Thermomicrobiaceae bacterium]|nr:AbrB/MazE/SpoVT family DNA-binding domain-containing protein [Thermomicrobiaceae bacterium]